MAPNTPKKIKPQVIQNILNLKQIKTKSVEECERNFTHKIILMKYKQKQSNRT